MKVAHELRKQVEDIFLDKPVASPDEQNNSSQGGDERTDQENQLEGLLQKVKGLKKKTGCKGPKAWHEKIGKGKRKSSRKDNSAKESDQGQEVAPSEKINKNSADKNKSVSQQPQDQEAQPSSKRNKKLSSKDQPTPQETKDQAQPSKKRNTRSSNKDQSLSQPSQDQEVGPSRKRNNKSSKPLPQDSQDQ